MNIITKICVVLLVVLVLVATGVWSSGSIIPANYKAAYENAQSERSAAVMTAANTELALARAQADLQNERTKRKTAEEKLKAAQDQVSGEIKGLRADNLELQKQQGLMNATVAKIEIGLAAAVKLQELEKTALAEARKENGDLLKASRDQTEDLRVANDKVGVYERQIKSNEREIANLKQTNDDLISQLKDGGTGQPPVVPGKGDAVTGKVTAAKNGLVSIDVGSNKGLKKGADMVIYRDAKIIAHLTIEDVGVSESSGVVYDKQGDVQLGDTVATPEALK